MNSIDIRPRAVTENEITKAVAKLFIDANYRLPDEVARQISECRKNEGSKLAASVLETIEENNKTAARLDIPICQDTGMAVLFCDIGSGVYIDGSLDRAVNEGVRQAYEEGFLRKSIVRDPLYDRVNTDDNTPALLHVRFDASELLHGKIRLTAAPKGFGSENMSALRMMTPAAGEDDVVSFVVESVLRAGANPCPPIFVGVGIGSDFEGVAMLAKRALLRDTPSENDRYRELEQRLLTEINKTDIGPQGFGGDTTAIAVRVEAAPTHIAGLPVAVNINCHVSRHKTVII